MEDLLICLLMPIINAFVSYAVFCIWIEAKKRDIEKEKKNDRA